MSRSERMIYLYRDDFRGDPDLCGGNPRDTEDSATVVRYWFNPSVRYAVEDIPDARCLRLVAERLVVRRMLGMGNLDADCESRAARVEVFGPGTPLFSELAMPSVFVAMAFVPLTPSDDGGRPCLARLYCVGGLAARCALPLDGMDSPALQGFSWFLEGVPLDARGRGIVGRSWLLAAHLLAEVVGRRDVQTARNLATHFIVTGDVEGGVIRKVELGHKLELVQRKSFARFTWLLPVENKCDLKEEEKRMIRRIEAPATLEKAYEMIQTMQNEATTAMLALLDKPNFVAFEAQLKIGADIQAVRKDLGVRPLQSVTMQIEKLSAELGKINDWKSPRFQDIQRRLSELRKMKASLCREGADAAFLFWNYARARRRDMIELLSHDYDLNACDECGYSAMDMAIDAGDREAQELLRSFGVRSGPYHRNSPAVEQAVKSLCDGEFSAADVSALMRGISAGLSPEMSVTRSFMDDHGYCGSVNKTLFLAIIQANELDLVEQCIIYGADVNAKLVSSVYYERPYGYDESSYDYMDDDGPDFVHEKVPLQWANSEEVRACLIKHGARMPDGAAAVQKGRA